MSDGEVIGWFIFGAFALICTGALIVDYEYRKGRKPKPNIRVPRETLWARTNKFHHGESK